MAKQDTPKKECPNKERLLQLIEAGKKLAAKVIEADRSPDMISVFSIARAHGYVVTDKFWSVELKQFVDLVNDYESKRKHSAPVVPIEQPPQA